MRALEAEMSRARRRPGRSRRAPRRAAGVLRATRRLRHRGRDRSRPERSRLRRSRQTAPHRGVLRRLADAHRARPPAARPPRRAAARRADQPPGPGGYRVARGLRQGQSRHAADRQPRSLSFWTRSSSVSSSCARDASRRFRRATTRPIASSAPAATRPSRTSRSASRKRSSASRRTSAATKKATARRWPRAARRCSRASKPSG